MGCIIRARVARGWRGTRGSGAVESAACVSTRRQTSPFELTVRLGPYPGRSALSNAVAGGELEAAPSEPLARVCYADPYSCNCLYVGDQQAYAEYKRLALQKQIADERFEAAEAEESAAIDGGLWEPVWW